MPTEKNDEPAPHDAALDQCRDFLAAIFEPEDIIEFRPIKPTSKKWATVANIPKIVEWLRGLNDRGAQCYFGANPRRASGGSREEDVALARCLCADFDAGVTVEEALRRIKAAGLPMPTVVIVTGNGVHCWWRLDMPITDRADWSRRQKAIAVALRSDESIHDWPRIMRLPGFVNHKYDHKPVAELVDVDTGRVYPVERLTPVKRKMSNSTAAFIDRGVCRAGGGRRETMFAAACDLRDNLWKPDDAVAVLMERMKQFGLSADDLDDCPRQIRNAWKKEPRATLPAALDDATIHDGAADLARPQTLNDVGAARRLAKMVRGQLAYVRERKEWIRYDGTRWAEHAEHVAVQLAKRMHDDLWSDLGRMMGERPAGVVKFVQESGTHARVRAAVALAATEEGINTSQADYDAHPWLLNVRNGIVDLRSGELLPHDPALRITQLAAVDYAADARSDLWEQFIDEVTSGNREVADFLQQAIGLALTGDVSDEVLITHSGEGGNGKSTFLEAVAAMLGDYAAAAPPGMFASRSFDAHPTEIASLRGKRFVTAIEQEANRTLRESLVKSLTGGDTIRTRRMREDFWEMKPTWHIHVAYNAPPRLTGTDDGIRRRLCVVPWLASFKGSPDLSIKQRLTGEGERSGILNWALDGLRRRLAAGRLFVPEAVRMTTDDYIADEDAIGRFLADRTERDGAGVVELRQLLQAFRTWMEADGSPRYVIDRYTATVLGRELPRRGYRKMRPDSGPHRKQTVIAGLRLVDTLDDLPAGDEEWSSFAR